MFPGVQCWMNYANQDLKPWPPSQNVLVYDSQKGAKTPMPSMKEGEKFAEVVVVVGVVS